MAVNEKIREYRKAAGLTQKALGELCGMRESQIRQYELGKYSPKLENAERIANALGVPVGALLFGSSESYEEITEEKRLNELIYLKSVGLNAAGKQKTIDYMDDLRASDKYRR